MKRLICALLLAVFIGGVVGCSKQEPATSGSGGTTTTKPAKPDESGTTPAKPDESGTTPAKPDESGTTTP